jgi:hypothetical protein
MLNPELMLQLANRLKEIGWPPLEHQPSHTREYFHNLLQRTQAGALLVVRPAYNADGTTHTVFEAR